MAEKDERPGWDEYFMKIASVVSERSTCLRRQVGAVLVRERQILSTGYNGAPKNMKHCCETGCIRKKMKVPSGEKHELCRGLHAEMNALTQAAANGMNVAGSTIYTTASPCSLCAKMLINAGIVQVVTRDRYPDSLSEDLFREAGITILFLDGET